MYTFEHVCTGVHRCAQVCTGVYKCVYVLYAGFYFLFKNYKGDTTSSFSTVGDTAMMLFGMTLGEYEV